MRQCLGEGELRAWLDGELPAEQAPAVERHLAECAGCAAAYRQVASRAALVSGWMESLSADIPAPAVAPRRVWSHPGAWAAAAALAAGLVLAVLMSRHSAGPPVRVAIEAPPAPVTLTESPAPMTTAAVAAPMPRARRTPVRPRSATPVEYYMALDEEPIDTGMVMRVALAGGMQADVIVDGDGRARAIRPISTVRKEQR